MRVSQGNSKAFTLVELIVVMAIIAILVALSVLGLSTVQRSVRDTQRLTSLETMNLEIESYKGANGLYPTDASVWFDASNTTVTLGAAGRTVTVSGPAVNAATTSADGTDYCYTPSATRSEYVLMATLENGPTPAKFGTLAAAACTTGVGVAI